MRSSCRKIRRHSVLDSAVDIFRNLCRHLDVDKTCKFLLDGARDPALGSKDIVIQVAQGLKETSLTDGIPLLKAPETVADVVALVTGTPESLASWMS